MKASTFIKKTLLLSCITVLIGSLIGCTSTNTSEDTTLRIGFFPNITHSQALIGMAEGQFQEAVGDEYTIKWKEFHAGPEQLEAMMAGEVDIGYIGPVPAINGHVRTKGEIQIIAGAANGGAVLLSRKNLLIDEISELSGKKVAVPQFGNTQHLFLKNLLLQNNLKESARGGSIEVLQVPNPDIKTLLDKGEIDFALVPEPWGARLVNEIGANVVLDYDQVWREGKYSTAVVMVRKEFLEKKPEVVEKFLKVHIDLTKYINEDKEKAKQIVNKQIKELTGVALPQKVLDEAYSRLIITENPMVEAINEKTQLSVAAEFLQGNPDISKLFDLEMLNRLVAKKVE